MDALTARQIEVLRLRSEGLSSTAIAKVLGCTVDTAKTHARRAKEKLGAKNADHAMLLAARAGLLDTNRGDPAMEVMQWKRTKDCEGGACAEAAVMPGGMVAVRSSLRPQESIVLTRQEWAQLRTGDFGEELP